MQLLKVMLEVTKPEENTDGITSSKPAPEPEPEKHDEETKGIGVTLEKTSHPNLNPYPNRNLTLRLVGCKVYS